MYLQFSSAFIISKQQITLQNGNKTILANEQNFITLSSLPTLKKNESFKNSTGNIRNIVVFNFFLNIMFFYYESAAY